MSNEKIVEKLYQDYLQKIGADETKMPIIQRREMRRSFFAGAGSLLNFISEESDKHADDDVSFLSDINNELLDFWQTQTNVDFNINNN